MRISDMMFDDFFSRPLPQEGFVIDPTRPKFFGLIDEEATAQPALHGYEITLDGTVVAPELRPKEEKKN